MNRIIKFRVWDNGYMYYDEPSIYISLDGTTYENSNNKYNTPNIEIAHYKQYVLMQYTGLKDKNGKEIYEGDIVRWEWNLGGVKWGPYSIVKFGTIYDGHENTKNGATGWICEDCFINRECYVCGNIYEHPELLEEINE